MPIVAYFILYKFEIKSFIHSLLLPSAAVSALAKFGAQNDDLLPSVLVLMQR